MAHRDFQKLSFPIACTMFSTAFVLPPSADAADWKIQPNFQLRESYTDNLRLAPPGSEKGDFITEMSPRISVTGIGSRLRLHTMYEMQTFFYANEGGSLTLHRLIGDANAELAKDLLFLDGHASVRPENISPFNPQVANSGNITDNRSEVRTYSISPYLKHEFGHEASSELRYTHDVVTANSNALDTTHGKRVNFKVVSGPVFGVLQWDAHYDMQHINYENSPDVDSKVFSGNARYLLSSLFSLTAGAGYEKYNFLSIQDKPQGTFWSAGAAWTPSERTSVAASGGRRFFGTTFSLAANHRMRTTVWSVGYQEDISTVRSHFLMPATIDTAAFLNQLWTASIPDSIARAQIVNNFIRDAGLGASISSPTSGFTNRVFLQKSLDAAVAVRGARSTLVFNASKTARKPMSTAEADADLPPNNAADLAASLRQSSANILWNWRLSPHVAANVGATYVRTTTDAANVVDKLLALSMGITKQFSEKVHAGINLSRRKQDISLGSGDYRENTIAVFVSIGI